MGVRAFVIGLSQISSFLYLYVLSIADIISDKTDSRIMPHIVILIFTVKFDLLVSVIYLLFTREYLLYVLFYIIGYS